MRATISVTLAALCVTVCFCAMAAAATPAGGGVIHACMLTKGKKATRGLLRVVPAASACKKRKGEKPLEWSVAGPAGQSGSGGASGAQGATGDTGAQGAPGSAATLDKTVTETLTSQAQQIQALTTKLLALEGGLGSVETGLSGVQATVAKTCSGLEAVTGQTNALRTTLLGVNTALGLVKALVPALAIPGVPGELTKFEC
jgi:hypothetical protein